MGQDTYPQNPSSMVRSEKSNPKLPYSRKEKQNTNEQMQKYIYDFEFWETSILLSMLQQYWRWSRDLGTS